LFLSKGRAYICDNSPRRASRKISVPEAGHLFLFYMISIVKPFALTDQISLLQRRGLIIDDSDETDHYFNHIGYYRLSGYWQFLQKNNTRNSFVSGANFGQVIEIF
jgi:hypothetical protein